MIKRKTLKTCTIILIGLSMQGCLATRPHIGASATGTYAVTTSPATKVTAKCIQSGVDNPYLIMLCAFGGALAGTEILNSIFIAESDYDLHYDIFITHLNSDKIFTGPSYTNWYNRNTGNSGIIKTTSVYYKGSIKCVDYNVTVDITLMWGFAGIDRRVEHGNACQLPNGKWVEKPMYNPYTGEYEVRR